MQIRKIVYNGVVVAIYIPKDTEVKNGVEFITPTDYPLQVGLLQHKEGKKVPPHIHRDLHYNVNTTQEFLYLMEGNGVKIVLFSSEWSEIETLMLSRGDAILFVSGGHSVDIPKDCKLFEVKQGPYPGDAEAKIFKV